MENPDVRVGVGVIVVKDGMVLLGKRKNAHGEGSWAFPEAILSSARICMTAPGAR